MSDSTSSKSGKPAEVVAIDWAQLDAPNMRSVSINLAHASAMISHTYSDASYCGFSHLTQNEQKDYLWAIHSRLKVASRALSRVMNRRRFNTPAEAAMAEQEDCNGQ